MMWDYGQGMVWMWLWGILLLIGIGILTLLAVRILGAGSIFAVWSTRPQRLSGR